MITKICKTCGKEFKVCPSRKYTAKFCSRKCCGVMYDNPMKGKFGRDHPRWKGNNAGYSALHRWVSYHRGSPKKCEHCGKDGLTGRQIHWANKSGNYLRDLTDWIRLCVSCHRKYDKEQFNLI